MIMKIKFQAALVLSAITFTLTTSNFSGAADLRHGLDSFEPSPHDRWTGVYLGGHLGWSFDAVVDPLGLEPPAGPPTQEPEGIFGGGQIGYDMQVGDLVFGIVADFSAADMSDGQNDGNFIRQHATIDIFGTGRARAGYNFGGFMPYVTGGLAWGHIEYRETCPPGAQFGFCSNAGEYDESSSLVGVGYVLGGGVAVAVWDNWSIGAEYQHIDLGMDLFTLGPLAFPKVNETSLDVVRFTIDYRF
jgi:outer membrane immunogenic protein